MRTKTLLLTAALSAAGVATSMAQVYSVNAVGYVNITIPIHPDNDFTFALISNPLNGTNNLIETILPAPPEGTGIYLFRENELGENVFVAGGFSFGMWDNTTPIEIAPGEGFFIQLPPDAPNPTTLTFVGEVPQGTLVNPMPAGFSLRASIVPQAGALQADLGLTPGEGDGVYQFDRVSQEYTAIAYSFGAWDNDEFPGGPLIGVGESFWYDNDSGEAEWSRTFTVN